MSIPEGHLQKPLDWEDLLPLPPRTTLTITDSILNDAINEANEDRLKRHRDIELEFELRITSLKLRYPGAVPRSAATPRPVIAPRRTGFMDLSAELRNMIYQLALVFPDERCTLELRHNKIDTSHALEIVGSFHPNVALLQVSKQVCSEAKPMLYGSNTFIPEQQTMHFWNAFCRYPCRAELLRSVELLFHRGLRSSLNALKNSPNLAVVTIDYPKSWRRNGWRSAEECLAMVTDFAIYRSRFEIAGGRVGLATRPRSKAYIKLSQDTAAFQKRLKVLRMMHFGTGEATEPWGGKGNGTKPWYQQHAKEANELSYQIFRGLCYLIL